MRKRPLESSVLIFIPIKSLKVKPFIKPPTLNFQFSSFIWRTFLIYCQVQFSNTQIFCPCKSAQNFFVPLVVQHINLFIEMITFTIKSTIFPKSNYSRYFYRKHPIMHFLFQNFIKILIFILGLKAGKFRFLQLI